MGGTGLPRQRGVPPNSGPVQARRGRCDSGARARGRCFGSDASDGDFSEIADTATEPVLARRAGAVAAGVVRWWPEDAPTHVIGGGNSVGHAPVFLAGQVSRVLLIGRSETLARGMSTYFADRIVQTVFHGRTPHSQWSGESTSQCAPHLPDALVGLSRSFERAFDLGLGSSTAGRRPGAGRR